ncbi:unnamed protein product (mitochondrion) [Plasmodiophora brassicae]|uniref:Uncharacterized protein n=1 Tax=Plasmodiophora brassicae TaxID=37360 RepID=A0A3P3Y6I9_PLABS|nr:unnamed protein product [Plasmodiophora brassicae]
MRTEAESVNHIVQDAIVQCPRYLLLDPSSRRDLHRWWYISKAAYSSNPEVLLRQLRDRGEIDPRLTMEEAIVMAHRWKSRHPNKYKALSTWPPRPVRKHPLERLPWAQSCTIL